MCILSKQRVFRDIGTLMLPGDIFSYRHPKQELVRDVFCIGYTNWTLPRQKDVFVWYIFASLSLARISRALFCIIYIIATELKRTRNKDAKTSRRYELYNSDETSAQQKQRCFVVTYSHIYLCLEQKANRERVFCKRHGAWTEQKQSCSLFIVICSPISAWYWCSGDEISVLFCQGAHSLQLISKTVLHYQFRSTPD